ncbi:MAG TPA: response regulator [Burkholderiaceae bacterium]
MNVAAASNQVLRTLVVDDNVDAATSLSELLQMLGCIPAVAFDGTMALQVAEGFQPALVFLDLEMPGPDGCEVVAQSRRSGNPLSRAYLVCLTARSSPADEARCRAAGFDRFALKPLGTSALREILLAARKRLRVAP